MSTLLCHSPVFSISSISQHTTSNCFDSIFLLASPERAKLLYFIKSKMPMKCKSHSFIYYFKKKNLLQFKWYDAFFFLIVFEKALVDTDIRASLIPDLLPAVVSMPFCPHNNFCFNVKSQYNLFEDILEGNEVQHM